MLLQKSTLPKGRLETIQCRVFFGKMCGVFACDLGTFITADRIAKISQNIGSRLVVVDAPRVNEVLRLT